uniref:TMC domain-containing protein n=1 Tax=viral metagenome TaxID=1070528 RepID=A0A6C0BMZ9_9ZZZZ
MIRHTDKGQLYITRDGISERGPPVLSSLDSIEQRYGIGTRLYFSFLKVIILSNAALGLLGIVSWSLFLRDRPPGVAFSWSDFFVSAYPRPGADVYWFTCGVLATVIWVTLGPAYWVWERSYKRNQYPRRVLDQEEKEIPVNRGADTNYLLGVTATFAALCVSILLVYGLVMAQGYVIETYGDPLLANQLPLSTAMSLVVALGFALCHTAWGHVSYAITRWERNKTWFQFRMSQAIKLITFKILLATCMYIFIATIIPAPPPVIERCDLDFAGANFFLVLVLDVVITFVMQTVWPKIAAACCGVVRPEFNIAEDLLQILFRQFIIYIGFFVFPLIGLVGLLANLIEYPVDHYRLLRVCGTPQYLSEKPGLFLLIFNGVVVLSAFLTYPNGALWMLFVPHLLPSAFQNCSVVGAISRI